MRKSPIYVGVLAAAMGSLTPAAAVAAPTEVVADHFEYGRDLISVTAANRHAAFPSASCTVWVNAEGLGVGATQLDGYHGLPMILNTHPLAGESMTTFASALADLKAKFPKAPAWLFRSVEKNQAAIEAACLQDHPEPYKVRSITKQDRDGPG
jgi:hypothetical protein